MLIQRENIVTEKQKHPHNMQKDTMFTHTHTHTHTHTYIYIYIYIYM